MASIFPKLTYWFEMEVKYWGRNKSATAAVQKPSGWPSQIINYNVELVGLYGADICDLIQRSRSKLCVFKVDFLWQSLGLSRVQGTRNVDVIMGVQQIIINKVQSKQLAWYEHVFRVDESRWQLKLLDWVPENRRKKAPRRSSSRLDK